MNKPIKVLHVESGLGNQMLDYVEFLAVKGTNSHAECYLETIISELPEADNSISQWNGYELEKVFPNIQEKNVKVLFSEEDWAEILDEVVQSKFWENHWNYPPYIVGALNGHGLSLVNECTSLDQYRREDSDYDLSLVEKCRLFITYFFRTPVGNYIKRKLKRLFVAKEIKRLTAKKEKLFQKSDSDVYIGHSLTFQFKNSGIEMVDEEIRKAFEFRELTDENNIKLKNRIEKENSVAIHVRRSDMLNSKAVQEYYRFGYFKRAVKYIKKHVDNPTFYFFCDPGSAEWCKENMNIFALDISKDSVSFVDWNKGEDSFRDMQLMSYCKHNIITNSSFGWWGAYLNRNPKKITISPEWAINTKVTV